MDRIDTYVVEDELGRGAMGVVYRAVHEFTQRTVALKVLSADFSDSEMGAERFRREVSVSARVDDDGIVEVFDAGRTDESFWYAMELLEGHELAHRMDRLPLDRGLTHIADAADTLAACHDCGIIHRDLKPSNIFLPDQGPATKLLDFGVASIRDARRATQTGFTLGTPYYMSPEQARDARSAEPASDIWSLGIIIYEFLTGDVPFDGDSAMNVMMSVVEEDPHPLPSTDVIPPELRDLLDRALAKSPEDRLDDASAFARQLRAIEMPSIVFPGSDPEVSGFEETLGADDLEESDEPMAARAPKDEVPSTDPTAGSTDGGDVSGVDPTVAAEAADAPEGLPENPYEEPSDGRAPFATIATVLVVLAVGGLGAVWFLSGPAPEAAGTAESGGSASAVDAAGETAPDGDTVRRARRALGGARTAGVVSLARFRLARALENAPLRSPSAGAGGRASQSTDDEETGEGRPAGESSSGRSDERTETTETTETAETTEESKAPSTAPEASATDTPSESSSPPPEPLPSVDESSDETAPPEESPDEANTERPSEITAPDASDDTPEDSPDAGTDPSEQPDPSRGESEGAASSTNEPSEAASDNKKEEKSSGESDSEDDGTDKSEEPGFIQF